MAYGEGLTKLNPCGDALIVSLLQDSADDAALLDVACGRGDRLKMLAAAFPKWRLCGLDADPENAAAAAVACPRAEICCGDAAQLPFDSAGFQIALCECSFSLFSRPGAAAAELYRVLAPGGIALVGDLFARHDAMAQARISDHGLVTNIYGRARLEQYFLSAGFRANSMLDRSEDLMQMLGQMLMDGTLCSCLSMDAIRQMKQLGTGYGFWIFRKSQ